MLFIFFHSRYLIWENSKQFVITKGFFFIFLMLDIVTTQKKNVQQYYTLNTHFSLKSKKQLINEYNVCIFSFSFEVYVFRCLVKVCLEAIQILLTIG